MYSPPEVGASVVDSVAGSVVGSVGVSVTGSVDAVVVGSVVDSVAWVVPPPVVSSVEGSVKASDVVSEVFSVVVGSVGASVWPCVVSSSPLESSVPVFKFSPKTVHLKPAPLDPCIMKKLMIRLYELVVLTGNPVISAPLKVVPHV